MLVFLPLYTLALDNGVALRPPMGWCSWNAFHRDFDETVLRQTADAMVKNGMRDAGYDFINVDGGWWAGVDTGVVQRNASGFPLADPDKFPSTLPATVAFASMPSATVARMAPRRKVCTHCACGTVLRARGSAARGRRGARSARMRGADI